MAIDKKKYGLFFNYGRTPIESVYLQTCLSMIVVICYRVPLTNFQNILVTLMDHSVDKESQLLGNSV